MIDNFNLWIRGCVQEFETNLTYLLIVIENSLYEYAPCNKYLQSFVIMDNFKVDNILVMCSENYK